MQLFKLEDLFDIVSLELSMESRLLKRLDEVRELDGKIAVKRQELDILEQKVRTVSVNVTSIHKDIQTSLVHLSELQKEFKEEKEALKKEKIELQVSIDKLSSDNISLSNDVNAYSTTIEEVKLILDDLEQQLLLHNKERVTVVNGVNDAKSEQGEDIRNTISELLRLNAIIDKKRLEKFALLEDIENERIQIQRDVTSIDVRKKDLKIYEKRLIKQYPHAIL